MLAYKKYQVDVLNDKEEIKEIVTVSAWSEVGAVEKVHKKVKGGDENRYRLTRL